MKIAGKDPTTVLPGTQGIGAQPAPECSTTDLGDYALGGYFPLDIGQRQS
jgi:hypothetical protein